jgi:hypothetical protein
MENTENKNESAAEKKKSKSSLREWFGLLSGLMLVSLAAALFAIGRAYRLGLIYQYGLDASQAPEDFYGYLYWGYIGGIPLAYQWLVAAVISLTLYAGWCWITDKLSARWKWLRTATQKEKDQQPAKLHVTYLASALMVFSLGSIVVMTYLAVAKAYEAGAQKGRDELLAISKSKQTDDQFIELHFGENDERIERGYRLLCTDKLCSIYDPGPDHKGVRVLQLDGLKEIRVFEKEPKQ